MPFADSAAPASTGSLPTLADERDVFAIRHPLRILANIANRRPDRIWRRGNENSLIDRLHHVSDYKPANWLVKISVNVLPFRCRPAIVPKVSRLPSPIVTFALLLATLCGAIFHLIVGGDVRRFAVFIVAAWIGFGVGHVAGVVFEVQVFTIGSLHLLPALIGAGVALLFVYALMTSRPASSTRRVRRKPAR